METIEQYRAMLGICRQRTTIEDDDSSSLLEEAEVLEKLITNATRRLALVKGPITRQDFM